MSKSSEISKESDALDLLPKKKGKLVGCPYDKSHFILPCRLPAHITRCARNHPNANLSRCPFDATHWLKPEDMQTHMKHCKSACQIMNVFDGGSTSEPRASTVELHKSSENWDDEPPAPTYDPKEFCEKNPVILNVATGLSKSQRVAFREAERQRHRDLNKLSTNASE